VKVRFVRCAVRAKVKKFCFENEPKWLDSLLIAKKSDHDLLDFKYATGNWPLISPNTQNMRNNDRGNV
jgi:hypothetical protein